MRSFILDEETICFQPTLLKAFKYYSANIASPFILVILLQKIHEECYNNINHDEDGYKWFKTSIKDLCEWSTLNKNSVINQLKKLSKHNLIAIKDDVENKKSYRVNYEGLEKFIKEYEKRINADSYRGLNRYSWRRLKIG